MPNNINEKMSHAYSGDRDWPALAASALGTEGQPLGAEERRETVHAWRGLFGGSLLLADGEPISLSQYSTIFNNNRSTKSHNLR